MRKINSKKNSYLKSRLYSHSPRDWRMERTPFYSIQSDTHTHTHAFVVAPNVSG